MDWVFTKADQPQDDDEEQVSRLDNIRPEFVALVDYGANWGGQRHFFVLKRSTETSTTKAVPDKDASSEDKKSAQEARSKKYGIQILESGSALSYPADGPTTESLYGDPVNLKYPLGYSSNERDAKRIRNALARFKQNSAAYSEASSRGRVYERIVRAALAEGIEVSYDPDDPVDALLPTDLKDRLSKLYKPEGGPKPPADKAGEWLIQSLIFSKDDFTEEQVRSWLSEHEDFGNHGIEETSTSYRARQYDPDYFSEFRTDSDFASGISAVYGHVKAELGKHDPSDLAKAVQTIATRARILDVQSRILALQRQHPKPAAPPAPPSNSGDTGAALDKRVDELERDNARQRAALAATRQDLSTERARRARLSKDTGRLSGLSTSTPQKPAVPWYPPDYGEAVDAGGLTPWE